MKETMVTHFKLLLRHSPVEAEETTKKKAELRGVIWSREIKYVKKYFSDFF